jgi:hypothetical protein
MQLEPLFSIKYYTKPETYIRSLSSMMIEVEFFKKVMNLNI